MLAKAAFPAFFLTLAAFVLFLLVTLSAPIIDKFYLLEARYPTGETAAHLGVFGVCFKAPPAGSDWEGDTFCTEPKAGYDFPVDLFGFKKDSDAEKVLTGAVAGALVINAVAAGFAGVCLVWAFLAWFCASRALEITTFIFTLITILLSGLSFFIDVGVVVAARSKINDYTDERITGHIGNAFWMAMGGTIAMAMAVCAAGCGSFGRYSVRYANQPYPNQPIANQPIANQPIPNRY